MIRFVCACLGWFVLVVPADVSAWCQPWPISSPNWGGPPPRPLPPDPRLNPPRVGVHEEAEPRVELKKTPETPRIAKEKFPLLPDPDEPKTLPPPAKVEPKEESKGVDEILVPAPNKSTEVLGEVKINFFNHREKEVTLLVNEETISLPSGQYVTIKLPRSFRWQEKGQGWRTINVPADAAGMEIVFRK